MFRLPRFLPFSFSAKSALSFVGGEAGRLKSAKPMVPKAVSFGAGLEPIVDESPPLRERLRELIDEVQFTVTTTTVSGEPIQHQLGLLTPANVAQFKPRPDAREAAIEKLQAEGCRLIRRGRFAVTMGAPAELVSRLIGTELVLQARARQSAVPATQMFASDFEPPLARDLFLAPPASLSATTEVCSAVDHVVFTPPPLYFCPSASAPAPAFLAVDEARIRQLLNVPGEFDGTGVRVAVVDTGFYPHPYYSKRNLRLRTVPTVSAPKPEIDSYGHGTAITYNVFAVAPKVEVLGFQRPQLRRRRWRMPPRGTSTSSAVPGDGIASKSSRSCRPHSSASSRRAGSSCSPPATGITHGQEASRRSFRWGASIGARAAASRPATTPAAT